MKDRMAYRDDEAAARARVAALERAAAARRAEPKALARWVRALRDERARLRHAIVWYRNGERYGFQRAPLRDVLARAPEPRLALPPLEQLLVKLGSSTADELWQRERRLVRAAECPRSIVRARHRAALLRAECDALRARVEELAERHPANPPPPALSPIWGRAVAVTVVAGLGLFASGLLALVWLALFAFS